jgi:hypothetical protein
MKRSFVLTVEILVFALGLILLPMQDHGVLAQSHDDEQQEDMGIETGESNPSGGSGEDDPTLDLGEDPPGEDHPSDVPEEDPSGEDHPSDDPGEDPSGEDYPSDDPGEDPSGEDYPTDDPEEDPSGEDYPSDDPGEDPSGEDYPTGNSEEDSSGEDHPGDESVDAAAAPGMAPQSTVPPKCRQAAGHVLYNVSNSSFGGGCSYLQPKAKLSFLNATTNTTFTINVEPPNLVTSSSFKLPAGSKTIIFTNSTSQVRGGSIIVNGGAGNLIEDIVICP